MTHSAREKPSSGPQGARPKSRKTNSISTDLNPNTSTCASLTPPLPRLARALPTVPPAGSGTHMLSSIPRGAIRPLPFCPAASTLEDRRFSSSSQASSSTPSLSNSSSTSSSASSSPSFEPSSTQFVSSSSAPMSVVLGDEEETSSFTRLSISPKSPIVFVRPKGESDSDCSEDEDDEAADTVEPYTFRLASYKKITASNWMPKWVNYRPNNAHPHPPINKWVTEKMGQRMTVEDYDNVIHILRTL